MGDAKAEAQVENIVGSDVVNASNLTNDRCNVCGLCHGVCRAVFTFAAKCPCLCLSIYFGPKKQEEQKLSIIPHNISLPAKIHVESCVECRICGHIDVQLGICAIFKINAIPNILACVKTSA